MPFKIYLSVEKYNCLEIIQIYVSKTKTRIVETRQIKQNMSLCFVNTAIAGVVQNTKIIITITFSILFNWVLMRILTHDIGTRKIS